MTQNANALRVLAGDGFSAFGAWIDFLAILTLAAWQFQVSPLQMAAVSAAGLLPGILAGPALGRWCDQGDTRQILQGSIALRLLATGAILFCQDYLLFVLLVGLRSVFASVAAPAINVLALRVTGPDERPRFYAVLNVINNSAKVLAPALGTVSSSMASEAVALMLSAACSAAALIAFAGVRVAAAVPAAATPADTAPHGSPPLPAVSAASLLPLLWVAATCAFFVFMVNNLVPLVLQRSGFDKSLLGVLVSSSGAGNILSGLWLARRAAGRSAASSVASRAAGRLSEMLVPALCQAAGFAAIALLLWQQPAQLALLLPLMFFAIGIFSARLAIAMNVHVATHHAARVGQVWGVVGSWQSAMILLAPLLGAVVLDRWGPSALFAFAAASAVVSLGLLGVLRRVGWRGFRGLQSG